MRHRDFAKPLRDALRDDMRALRTGPHRYAHVHPTPSSQPVLWYAQTIVASGKRKRLGSAYADPEAAALVRVAFRLDPGLGEQGYRERWLADMTDDAKARRWLRTHARGPAASLAARRLRASPNFGAWRTHVRYKPGNSGAIRARSSFDQSL